MNTQEHKPRITWRLHAVMVNQGIKTATDLKTALEKNGIALSMSTVSRLVYKEPIQISLGLLNGLCNILNCTPNDLLFTPA